VITEDAVSSVLQTAGPIDLLVAQFQPLIAEFQEFPLHADFPYLDYARLLAAVVNVSPRFVLPGACGFAYTTDWLNNHGFPMSEAQFVADLAETLPTAKPIRLNPGDLLSTETFAVVPGGLRFVKPQSSAPASDYWWSPVDGIPPLRDHDPFGYGSGRLRTEVPRYLDETFLVALNGPEHFVWRRCMAQRSCVWQLDVIYPDGLKERRMIDFRQSPLTWLPDRSEFPKVHTACAASMILGVQQGDMDGYAGMFGMLRWSRRLYQPTPVGLNWRKGERDEPLSRVLMEASYIRQVDRSLRNLGL
jgi:hypothetical protein